MLYRALADLVMLTHFAFIALVVLGPLLAVRWPRLLWIQIPAAIYALAIVVVGFTCPLTPLERMLREKAGQAGYEGGFVDRYIEGVIYPGSLTRVAQLLAAMLMLIGYVLVLRMRPPAARRRLPAARSS